MNALLFFLMICSVLFGAYSPSVKLDTGQSATHAADTIAQFIQADGSSLREKLETAGKQAARARGRV